MMRPLLCALLAAAGCSGDGSLGPDAEIEADAGPLGPVYLPLAVGNTWTYKVTDPINPSAPPEMKTQTVYAIEDVGGEKAGVLAFRLETLKPLEKTVSWQIESNGVVVRHREIEFNVIGATEYKKNDTYFLPKKPRMDRTQAHTTLGAVWNVSYTEKEYSTNFPDGLLVSKSERWEVEAVGETITVDAGTFDCLRVHRVVTIGTDIEGSNKTYWFAQGVGKIKETGLQTEELSSYSLP